MVGSKLYVSGLSAASGIPAGKGAQTQPVRLGGPPHFLCSTNRMLRAMGVLLGRGCACTRTGELFEFEVNVAAAAGGTGLVCASSNLLLQPTSAGAGATANQQADGVVEVAPSCIAI
eukprot:scaffold1279_cov306-Prasinococcus_capsulatus_cf.AAC.2